MGLMRLLPASARVQGRVRLHGEEISGLAEKSFRDIRGRRIGMIFQDPMTALNPVMTIGAQVSETLRRHLGMGGAAAAREAVRLLDAVRIPDAVRRFHDYPHLLSGGQRQRVMITLAIACKPALLIADEPTTALDVTVQAQILALLDELRREIGMALLLITHDMGVVAGIADQVAVMYAGRVVEQGTADEVFYHPRHPYTAALQAACPRIDAPADAPLPRLRGAPGLFGPAGGCAFSPRCDLADSACSRLPALTDVGGHAAACWHAAAVVPGVVR